MSGDEQLTTAPVLSRSGHTTRGNRLLHKLAGYGLSRAATEGLLAVRGVALALVLGPAAFGFWALLRIGTRYAAVLGWAVYRGLERELLQGDRSSRMAGEERTRIESAALAYALVVFGTVAGLAFAAGFLMGKPEYRLLLHGFAAASFTEALYNYSLVSIRVHSGLRYYAFLELGTTVLHVIASVLLAQVWGLPGAFAGLALANLLGVASVARRINLRPVLKLEPLRRLLAVGAPVAFSILLGILLSTADRWVVAFWGGAAMLGYYAFAASVMTPAIALGQATRIVVFPQVYGEAGSLGAASAVQAHLERSLLPFARLLPPLLGVLGFVAGVIIAIAIPRYIPAIAPARMFVLVGVANGLVTVASIGAVAAGRQRQLPAYAALALCLTLGLSVLALNQGLGLLGVAGASLLGNIAFAAALLRENVRQAGIPRELSFVIRALVPLIWCAAATAIAGAVFPEPDPAGLIRGLGLYLLLLLPLAASWLTEWRRVRPTGARPATVPRD